ncbi:MULTISPECIES: DNA/RNA non-specific endonuclease [Bacillaceae]|uniref:DNA/RNA non-specific endonuclease n=1 Tax=Bacillaceae TaxID=186817 RepID=UPI001E05E8F9|nr:MULTISPECIES: DNA/RNA non-specific endonuclease [Bacillaceae]CAH0173276.1 Putative ribonuclease YeeF [Peribacillus sp. Bi134]
MAKKKIASGTKFVPYSKEFAQKQVQKVQATITDIARSGKTTLKNIGEAIGKKEIPKRISMEQVSLAGGPTLRQVMMEKQTIKEAYQKFAVKNSNVEAVSGESVPKGIDNVRYGEQYTKVNRKKTLKPNVEYTTKEGYKYTTDDNGRIAIAEAKLELGKAKRDPYAQRKVGGDDRLSNDDGGHLIASIFKGSGEIDNLVPMNATLNRSENKTLENTWKKALVEGKEVTIKVKPIYEAQSARPSEFKINYVIDGKKYSDRLTNYLGGK